MPFIVIFIVVPLLELTVFAAASEHIGLGSTLFFALLTAVLGGILVRHQGLSALAALRDALNRGQAPLDEIFDSFCLIVAGATLITPGFITDTIGFLLLVPAVRRILRDIIKTRTRWAFHTENFHTHAPGDASAIEGEYEQLDSHDKR